MPAVKRDYDTMTYGSSERPLLGGTCDHLIALHSIHLGAEGSGSLSSGFLASGMVTGFSGIPRSTPSRICCKYQQGREAAGKTWCSSANCRTHYCCFIIQGIYWITCAVTHGGDWRSYVMAAKIEMPHRPACSCGLAQYYQVPAGLEPAVSGKMSEVPS